MIDRLYEAAKRTMERHWDPLIAMAWADSGGPNECAHGVAAGLPCGRCYADYGEKADPAIVAALIEVYRAAKARQDHEKQVARGRTVDQRVLSALATMEDDREAIRAAIEKVEGL